MMPSSDPNLDHVVYAAPDLAAAVDDFQARTGIRPAPGGRHLGRGTRNFLVGLGGQAYLEIIGPDPEHPARPGVALPFGIDSLIGPKLLTWAVRSADIDAAATVSARAGADLGEPAAMSRRTPSGSELRWRLASALPLPFLGVTPFLIDWGDTTHPTADPDLPVVELIALSGTTPDPVAVQVVLDALGVVLPLTPGPAGLRATLRTPAGAVVLD